MEENCREDMFLTGSGVGEYQGRGIIISHRGVLARGGKGEVTYIPESGCN